MFNTTGRLDSGVLVFSYVEKVVSLLTLRSFLVTMHFISLHRNNNQKTRQQSHSTTHPLDMLNGLDTCSQ